QGYHGQLQLPEPADGVRRDGRDRQLRLRAEPVCAVHQDVQLAPLGPPDDRPADGLAANADDQHRAGRGVTVGEPAVRGRVMSTASTRTDRLPSCPLGGGRRLQPSCRSRERVYGLSEKSFAYSRCAGCGVVVQSLRPVEADVAAFYPTQYMPYQANPFVR